MGQPKQRTVSAQPLPVEFRHVRLVLAREAGHPEGNRNYGYDLVVPLDSEGKLDPSLWTTHRDRYRFVHFRPGAEREAGHLVHGPGGSWAFHYDIRGDEDDAGGFRFQSERFIVGEYVSIREDDGFHTYQVIAVGPV
jgi:hypothetical protein